MTAAGNEHELIRVQGPALPVVTLRSEANPTAPASELIRVQGPALPSVTLRSDPPPVVTVLELPLTSGEKGEQTFAVLNSIIQKVNEIEALFGRAGVWVDGTRSGVCEEKIEIALAPNDPTDAIETCKRLADYLFAAVRNTSGVTVKVFTKDQPDTPVYKLAI